MPSKRILVSALIAASNLLPGSASASVVFTEVMYDVPGADSGREWVEIQNTGSKTVDLANWKFFEANTNHALLLYQGAGITPGGYAVIADNPLKFLADWPSYTGVLFDSSFSLSGGSGETLVLRDDSGSDAASVAYDPSLGAAGDGNTLQWDGAKWVAAPATPGAVYVPGASDSEDVDTSDTENEDVWNPVIPKEIFIDAGSDRTVFVGADFTVRAEAIGIDGEPLNNARYVWSFGDGGRLEGQSVRFHYLYPGVYTVVLDASSGTYAASDRAVFTAIPAEISITEVASNTVSIKNSSSVELDLGGWILRADGKEFVFPEHTILMPDETVSFSDARTNIVPSSPQAVSLLYPDGMLAAAFQEPLMTHRTAEPQSVEEQASADVSPPGEVLGAVAAASSSDDVSERASSHFGGIWPWMAAAALIAALGSAALFFFSAPENQPAAHKDPAQEYEIEEIE